MVKRGGGGSGSALGAVHCRTCTHAHGYAPFAVPQLHQQRRPLQRCVQVSTAHGELVVAEGVGEQALGVAADEHRRPGADCAQQTSTIPRRATVEGAQRWGEVAWGEVA